MSKHLVLLAGNIASGKTSLTERLGARLGWRTAFESVADNPYLADFYADMRTWAFRSQLFFLTHKFRLHLALQDDPGSVIQDRTIYEDAEIFARNLFRQRLIDKRDFDTYWELYQSIKLALRPPDLMIQLRCPVRTLRKRICARGRAFEQDIPASYLRRLNRLYEDWFASYSLSPVLVLESDKLDYVTDLIDHVELLEQIERYL